MEIAHARRRYAQWAIEDSRRCIELLPKNNEPHLFHEQARIYLACTSSDTSWFSQNIKRLNKLLGDRDFTDSERAFLINCRAQSYHFLGDLENARVDYGESIRLAPEEPSWRINRAQYWEQRGQAEFAAEDRRSAARIQIQRALPE